MKASVAIQVLPSVSDENELIRIVDEVIDYIKSTGLNYYVGPFETTIEGESYDELMEIVANCQKVAIKAGCDSVSAYIKVVYNPEGEVLTIDKKVTKHHQSNRTCISYRSGGADMVHCVRPRGCAGIYAAVARLGSKSLL